MLENNDLEVLEALIEWMLEKKMYGWRPLQKLGGRLQDQLVLRFAVMKMGRQWGLSLEVVSRKIWSTK